MSPKSHLTGRSRCEGSTHRSLWAALGWVFGKKRTGFIGEKRKNMEKTRGKPWFYLDGVHETVSFSMKDEFIWLWGCASQQKAFWGLGGGFLAGRNF